MSYPVITIGREFGSGGRIIAQQVAEALSIPFYDKALITLAAKQTGFSEDYIKEAEQVKTSSFLYSLYMSTQTLPMSDQVFIGQSEVIRQVAADGPCVIVGRCSDYVLRAHPNCLNVFIHAPLEARVARARDAYHVQAADPRAYVIKQDKARSSYYEHFAEQPWGKAQAFDLAISSRLGLDTVAHTIIALAKERGTDA